MLRTLLISLLLAAFAPCSAFAQPEPSSSDPVAPDATPPESPPGPAPSPVPTGPVSLLDTIALNPQLRSFKLAVDASGLATALEARGPFTLLAPSDEAIARLDKETISSLLDADNREALTAIIAHHLIPGRLTTQDIAELRYLSPLSGQRLECRATPTGPMIAGASIGIADITATNGIVHVIDSFLIPTTRDLFDTIQAAGRFSTFLSLIEDNDLRELLTDTDESRTLFAPTNEAFDALPADALELLGATRNRAQLRKFIESHILPQRVPASQLSQGGSLATLARSDMTAAVTKGQLRVGVPDPTALVVASDFEAINGIVHVVDALLIAADQLNLQPAGRLLVGLTTARASSALARQVAVDGKTAIVVTSVTPKSAAERAGILDDDVIVSINGVPATTSLLSSARDAVGYGGNLEFVLYRDGQRKTIIVPVGVGR